MESDHVRRCALPVALAAFAVSSASGQTLQASIDPPVRVTPKRIAAIDAEGKIIGDWVEYVDRLRPAGWCSRDLAYDTFWPDPETGFPIGGEQCEDWFEPYTRWYFGPEYHSPQHYDDAVFADTINPIDRYQIGWNWATSDTLLIRVSVYEMSEYGIQCERVPIGTFRGGFIIDFGFLGKTSYVTTSVDLCDLGAMFDAPVGPALIRTEYLQWYDGGSGEVRYSPGPVAPMMWGIEPDLEPGGVGEHVGWVLADDTVVNEQIDFPGECHDWSGLVVCPDPLGVMHAFYSAGAVPNSCDIDLYVSTMRVGYQTLLRVTDAIPGRVISIRYTKQPNGTGPPQYGQLGNFCAESELRPLTGLGGVCRVVADESRTVECETFSVPIGYEGVTYNFQAFQSGHCPDPCNSNRVSRTVIRK